MVNRPRVARNHPNQLSREVVDRVLLLRKKYHLSPIRIVWYMARYHGIEISDASVYRTLCRHGVNRLPRNVGLRKIHTKRHQKQVPGHQIQVDGKFLKFIDKSKRAVTRYQYTAIDDATRVKALKIYARHNQKTPVILSITSSKSFLSEYGKSAQTGDMSFRPNSIGMSRTRVSVMSTSSRALLD